MVTSGWRRLSEVTGRFLGSERDGRSGGILFYGTQSSFYGAAHPQLVVRRSPLSRQSNRPRLQIQWRDVAEHGLLQLGIDFIRDRHHVRQ